MKVETRCHPLDPKTIYVWVEGEWYPMHEVPTGPVVSTSNADALATVEERKVLYGKTLRSQEEANAEVSGIVVQMEARATQRKKAGLTTASTQDQSNNEQRLESEMRSTRDAQDAGKKSESMAERLKRLRQEGFYGKRYS
jgi:type IV secretory pathway VirB10-like protein